MSNILYIGLTGKAGSGKGEVAKIIHDYKEASILVCPLALELKRIAIDHFGWNGKKDVAGRKLLQTLGTECGREYGGKGFWIDKWNNTVDDYIFTMRNIDASKQIIIVCDDIRFDDEAQNIITKSGIIWHITGRSHDMGEQNNHISENGIDEELVNIEIDNSKSLKTLQVQIKKQLSLLLSKGQ